MACGKIQIKRIENSMNRQVTYSKRRNGLFKKANELTVLCDAKVSIIMFSSSNKLQEFISPSITTKQMYDQYQKVMGIDLWSSHYEKMQETLRKLREVANKLRMDIMQRMGASLNDLRFEELFDLDQEIESSLKVIRERKFKHLSNQIDTSKKKGKNAGDIHRDLVHQFVSMDARGENPHFGLVDNEGDYDTVLGFPTGSSRVYALHLQTNQPNIHSGSGGSDLTTFALLD